jgi:hypothetical protein
MLRPLERAEGAASGVTLVTVVRATILLLTIWRFLGYQLSESQNSCERGGTLFLE